MGPLARCAITAIRLTARRGTDKQVAWKHPLLEIGRAEGVSAPATRRWTAAVLSKLSWNQRGQDSSIGTAKTYGGCEKLALGC